MTMMIHVVMLTVAASAEYTIDGEVGGKTASASRRLQPPIDLSKCTIPSTAGYDFSDASGELGMKRFEAFGVVCAVGYTGTVSYTVCATGNTPYSVSGCEASAAPTVAPTEGPSVAPTPKPPTVVDMECGKNNSDDCSTEFGNAWANGSMAGFCIRCSSETGANPLRNRCQACCENCVGATDATPINFGLDASNMVCGTKEPNGADCDAEANNAVVNSAVTGGNSTRAFCARCSTERGADPLRDRCQRCCETCFDQATVTQIQTDGMVCGTENSNDCNTEFSNAVANGDTGMFCSRCREESGANPLRSRCMKCCDSCGVVGNTGSTGTMVCGRFVDRVWVNDVSSDCDAEYNNAMSTNDLTGFCHRCSSEEGSNPLRSRCSKCCSECNKCGCSTYQTNAVEGGRYCADAAGMCTVQPAGGCSSGSPCEYRGPPCTTGDCAAWSGYPCDAVWSGLCPGTNHPNGASFNHSALGKLCPATCVGGSSNNSCGVFNSDDCLAEYWNAQTNDFTAQTTSNMDGFCARCSSEGGNDPLRNRCEKCCSGCGEATVLDENNMVCGMTNDASDCISEAANAVNNGDTAAFCTRCRTEGGSDPLRGRCRKCCDMCQSVPVVGNGNTDPGTNIMTCSATANTSDDCDAEAANAVNNGNAAGFCERCVKETGANPLRNRCKKCCDMCQEVHCEVGEWEGTWEIIGSQEAGDAAIGQTGAMTLNLAVENYDNLLGTGTDSAGKFTVNGKIVPTRLHFVKTYVTHTVEYTGTSGDAGENYAGTWLIAETVSIAETWGNFTMKPPAPCVTAITSQGDYKPPTVQFTYETELPNGFGSFSPDTYQETVCGASSATSCDSVANTFTYRVDATYTLPDAATMSDQECANAIAVANGIVPSAVTCSLTAVRRVTADGRRLTEMTANAGISMTYPTQAQAVAASVKDTSALKSALGGSMSAPTLVGTPTMKVKAETKVAVPDGSTDVVKGELDANLATSLSGAIPGTTASIIPVRTEAGAPTPSPPPATAPTATSAPITSPSGSTPTPTPNGSDTETSSANPKIESVLVAAAVLTSMWGI